MPISYEVRGRGLVVFSYIEETEENTSKGHSETCQKVNIHCTLIAMILDLIANLRQRRSSFVMTILTEDGDVKKKAKKVF